MCGIIGVFKRENSAELVYQGLEILKERGQDNFGIFTQNSEPRYGKTLNKTKFPKNNKSIHSIGHCLHSIVSFVEQPFVSKESVFAINCEIYNWKDIKKKHKLDTENDAETVLKLIEKKGVNKIPQLLKELDGVFALSYWYKDKLYLARDILGIKPLWYATNNGFAFASEKKALEALGYMDINELNPRKILVYDILKDKFEFIEREFFNITPISKASGKKHEEEVDFLLKQAILKRIPDKKFGILFSGGIDSTILALIIQRLGYKDFTCYTAVLEDKDLQTPKDLVYAEKIAKALNLNHKVIKIPLGKVKEYLKEIIPLIEDTNVVKAGVAIPFHAACQEAKKDGCKVIFSGLGSEEIFAGYDRHKNSQDINKECVSGLLKMYERDLYRDDVITMHNNLELRVPFLDHKLVNYALKIPARYKLGEGVSKLILRKVALNLGLNKEFSMRKKTAAQYGSNFHKSLKKLTKKAGLKYISEYLRQFYPKHNVRLGALFSSGKDSTFAVHVMLRQNYGVECLITLKSKNQDSYMFHTPNIDLVDLQAKALGIPLIKHTTAGEKEDELKDLKEALKKAKKEYKIEGVVTGALFSSYQRDRIEKVCDELGLKIFAPLWHISQEQEIREIIEQGFEIVMSSIAAYGLDKKWLNKTLTEKDVDKLAELDKKIGFNVAGEGGEYESLVLDAPLFTKHIKILKYHIDSENENTARLIVEKAALIDKK
jgi:diphthine-ammonia ligase